MSKIILKKNGTDYLFGLIPIHYPADRVYLDGDTTKTVQDKCARKADLTNLDLTGTTNTTGSTIASGTFFYLNGTLVRAKTTIANGTTFTLNTNYIVISNGGLNNLRIKLKTVSGMTTANGNIELGLSISDAVVIAVIERTTGYRCIPYVLNTAWWATVGESSGATFNIKTSQSVTVDIYYTL